MKYTLLKNKVTLFVHMIPKWEDQCEGLKVKFNDIEAFEIVSGESAKQIENEVQEQGLEFDILGEYLVLYHENGETETYRNSFVEMFNF